MRRAHTHPWLRRGARLIGVALGLTLSLALCAGIAFGHRYHRYHAFQAHQGTHALSLLSPASLPTGCTSCVSPSSSACYNGCAYDGIMYYYRNGYWYAFDGAYWYCYYNGCWQICGS
jgi:hypothetical protein